MSATYINKLKVNFFMKIKSKVVKVSILIALIFSVVAGSFIAAVFITKGKLLQDYIDSIMKRQRYSSVTAIDKLFLRAAYEGMILYGTFAYPEATVILKEYLYGSADTIQLPSLYFSRAPFIREKLEGLKGDKGPIYIRLREDRRIAYAVNGFFLRVTEDGEKKKVRLYQDIVFNTNYKQAINTGFYFFSLRIRLPDQLIHTVKKRKNNHL
ncbi:MAG: hypothetical protein GX640_07360, partial [Fibrobacter sp.]|nr:hypothetical protein [Fibrobacter sp.]